MSQSNAQIQVISRSNYAEQHIISVPSSLSAIGPSSVRVRSSLLSLIVNTLTCASNPNMKNGWWEAYPLPPGTPAPFNDATKYGRIGTWGWATVLESTIDDVPSGSHVYGFMPIATLPVDLQLKHTGTPGLFRETSPHRAVAQRIFNTYEVHAADAVGDDASQALDALAKPTFRLGYLLARFCLNSARCVNPGRPGYTWTAADADLADSVVVLASATSKTALGVAYMLASPGQEKKPARIVGVTSAASVEFAKKTGWYSDVLTYDEAERVAQLGVGGRRVLIVDFGGRQAAAGRILNAVEKEGAASVQLMVAGPEVKKGGFQFTPEAVTHAIEQGVVLLHTGLLAETVEDTLGAQGETVLKKEYDQAWNDFKQQGGFPGMDVVWGRGLDEFGEAYQKICDKDVEGGTTFVFKV